jgi:putative transposase
MGKPPALPGRLPKFDICWKIRKPPECEPLKAHKQRRPSMNQYQSLSHTTWDCKYHLVWIPKYRKKVIYGQLRKHLGEILRELALHKESKILEGHLMGDHVHMMVSTHQNIQFLKLSAI